MAREPGCTLPLIEVCDNHRVEPQLVWLLLTASLYVFDPSDEPLIVAVTGACLAAFMAGAPDSALASNEKICVSEPVRPAPDVIARNMVCRIPDVGLDDIALLDVQIVHAEAVFPCFAQALSVTADKLDPVIMLKVAPIPALALLLLDAVHLSNEKHWLKDACPEPSVICITCELLLPLKF